MDNPIITQLDELKAKATPEAIREHHTRGNYDAAEWYRKLDEFYPALRQAVLDGEKYQKELINRQLDLISANDKLIKLRSELERYKVAGEALAKAVEEYAGDNDYLLNNALTTYRTAIEDLSK